jgi:glycosyltransferase involved in cell wall biosynthesis
MSAPNQGALARRPPAATFRLSRRRSIAVAVPFPVWPPMGGGQVRLHELCRRLARWMDVELVCLDPGGHSSRLEVEPHYRQTVVGASPEHRAREAALRDEFGGVPITDVAMPLLLALTPDYARAFRRAAPRADAQVASHPYAAPVMAAHAPYLPLVYEAQDVEVDLKEQVLGRSGALHLVESVERWCATTARKVLACSAADRERLAQRYGVPAERIDVIPNGVDDERIRFTPPTARGGSNDCLFIGSHHPPNVAAVRRIAQLARAMPDVRFLVAGNVRNGITEPGGPDNLQLLGPVTEERKAALLASAAVALNPLEHGSGTSLKVLEYCAAGLPVLSTPHGLRGLDDLKPVCEVAEPDALEAALGALLARPSAERTDVDQARRIVEARYAWNRIAEAARDSLAAAWG